MGKFIIYLALSLLLVGCTGNGNDFKDHTGEIVKKGYGEGELYDPEDNPDGEIIAVGSGTAVLMLEPSDSEEHEGDTNRIGTDSIWFELKEKVLFLVSNDENGLKYISKIELSDKWGNPLGVVDEKNSEGKFELEPGIYGLHLTSADNGKDILPVFLSFNEIEVDSSADERISTAFLDEKNGNDGPSYLESEYKGELRTVKGFNPGDFITGIVDSVHAAKIRIFDSGDANLDGTSLPNQNLSGTDFSGSSMKYCNFSGSDLSKANLSNTDLREASLKGTNMSNAVLKGANLNKAYLEGANLNKADLENANLKDANLKKVNLWGANVIGTVFQGINLSGAKVPVRLNLSGRDLSGADLSDVDLWCCDLSNANLSNANLEGAFMSGANLRNADLTGARMGWVRLGYGILDNANLSKAYLGGAYLRHARLHKVNLSNGSLYHVDMRGGDLSEADLTGADLNFADLWGVNLTNTKFNNTSVWGTNLAKTNHWKAKIENTDIKKAVFY